MSRLRKGVRERIVGEQQLAEPSGFAQRGVGEGDLHAVKTLEPRPRLRTVVSGQEESTFEGRELADQLLELLIREVVLVEIDPHVWGVAIEEGGRPVVLGEDG